MWVFGRCGIENGCGCEWGRMVCGRKELVILEIE